jgi:hypothetical protein
MEPTQAVVAGEPAELDAVRIRRAELRETLNLLENAVAGSTADPAGWASAVRAGLRILTDDFRAHIEVTEGPDGLHQAILAGDLRLANQVSALTAEHAVIVEAIAALVADSETVADADVPGLRDRVGALLERIVRHRQRGADLIYEAYATDIGGAD